MSLSNALQRRLGDESGQAGFYGLGILAVVLAVLGGGAALHSAVGFGNRSNPYAAAVATPAVAVGNVGASAPAISRQPQRQLSATTERPNGIGEALRSPFNQDWSHSGNGPNKGRDKQPAFYKELDARLTVVSHALSNSRASLHCATESTWHTLLAASGLGGKNVGGVTYPPGDLIWLAPGVCLDLYVIIRSYQHNRDWQPQQEDLSFFRDLVYAVHVLTHESVHASGVSNEALTDCYALQLDYKTAMMLGVPPNRAPSFALYYWEHIYPTVPPNYYSTNCRDGSSGWDISPSSSVWPQG